jgi:hypothetical protein
MTKKGSLRWKDIPDNLKDRIVKNSDNGGGFFVRDAKDLLPKKSKYHNVKVEYDGMKFDSTKEKNTYIELKLMQKEGAIIGVECQHPMYYGIKFSTPDETKSFEKRYCYIADFKVAYPDGHFEIWDVKGGKFLTREFKHKRMIIEKLYGIEIKIV